jgi:hypothetical protein
MANNWVLIAILRGNRVTYPQIRSNCKYDMVGDTSPLRPLRWVFSREGGWDFE